MSRNGSNGTMIAVVAAIFAGGLIWSLAAYW